MQFKLFTLYLVFKQKGIKALKIFGLLYASLLFTLCFMPFMEAIHNCLGLSLNATPIFAAFLIIAMQAFFLNFAVKALPRTIL